MKSSSEHIFDSENFSVFMSSMSLSIYSFGDKTLLHGPAGIVLIMQSQVSLIFLMGYQRFCPQDEKQGFHFLYSHSKQKH